MQLKRRNEVDRLKDAAVIETIFGVTLAGMFYPTLLTLLMAPFWLWTGEIPPLELIAAPFYGLVAGTFVLIPAVGFSLIVAAAASSVGRTLRPVAFGSIVGGLTGYCLAGVPFLLGPVFGPPALPGLIKAFLIGPLLGMVWGQLGGVSGAAGYLGVLTSSGRRVELPVIKAQMEESQSRQFSIREMLVLMAWACALLALLKPFGFLTPRVVFFIVAWVVLQTASYFVGQRIVKAVFRAQTT